MAGNRFANVFLAVCGVLLIAGCATLDDDVVPPEASVADIRFVNVTPFETNAVVTVRIDNENPFPLGLDGAVFHLALGGRKVGKAMTGERIRLPRLESVTREVPLRMSNLALALQAVDIMHSNEIRYGMSSVLYVNHRGRTHTLRSRSRGIVELEPGETQRLRNFLNAHPAKVPRL